MIGFGPSGPHMNSKTNTSEKNLIHVKDSLFVDENGRQFIMIPSKEPFLSKKSFAVNLEFQNNMFRACYLEEIVKGSWENSDKEEIKHMKKSCNLRINVLKKFTKLEQEAIRNVLLSLIRDSDEQKKNYKKENDMRRFIWEESEEEVCETIYNTIYDKLCSENGVEEIKDIDNLNFENICLKDKILALKWMIAVFTDVYGEKKEARIKELTKIINEINIENESKVQIKPKSKPKKQSKKKQEVVVEAEKPKQIQEKKIIGKCIADGDILEGSEMMKINCDAKCEVFMHMSCYLKHKRENGEYTCVTQDCPGEISRLIKILNDEETELTVHKREKPVPKKEIKKEEVKKEEPKKQIKKETKKEKPKTEKFKKEEPQKQIKIEAKIIREFDGESKLEQFLRSKEESKKVEESKKLEEELSKRLKNSRKIIKKTTTIVEETTSFWDERQYYYGVGEIFFLCKQYGLLKEQISGTTLKFFLQEGKKYSCGQKVGFSLPVGSRECDIMN